MPVYQLLGGKTRSAVAAYAHASGDTLIELEDDVRRYWKMATPSSAASSGRMAAAASSTGPRRAGRRITGRRRAPSMMTPIWKMCRKCSRICATSSASVPS